MAVNTVCVVLDLTYKLQTKPSDDPLSSKLELLNDAITLIISDLFYFQTDYVSNEQVKYDAGTAICSFVILMIVVNMGAMVFVSVRKAVLKIKRCLFLRRLLK